MRRLLLICLLAGIPGCASLKQSIVWEGYPGANVLNQCAPYARAATAALHRRSVESYYVEYEWTESGYTGAHAVCIFRDPAGELAWVDNMNPKPHHLRKAATVLELVQQITSCATRVSNSPKIKL